MEWVVYVREDNHALAAVETSDVEYAKKVIATDQNTSVEALFNGDTPKWAHRTDVNGSPTFTGKAAVTSVSRTLNVPCDMRLITASVAASIINEPVWMVYTHCLGGNMIAVETTDDQTGRETVARYLHASVDELFNTNHCEDGCGPTWSLTEGAGVNYSHPGKPNTQTILGLLEDVDGEGTERARFITRDEIGELAAL